MIAIMPLIQLLVMPLAADYEIKNINVAVVNHDQSSLSGELISALSASPYFKIHSYTHAYHEALEEFERDHADLILEIPSSFEKDLRIAGESSLFLAVNAINGMKGIIGNAYLQQIISGLNREIRIRWSPDARIQVPQIEISVLNWFNPLMNYPSFMVPGILVILITMVGAYMCSLNIVKEKELGTIEQINVSPIPRDIFILGKLIPFWIIGMILFSVGLFGIGYGIYGIKPQGSLLMLYVFLAVYLIAVLGIGFVISTYAQTQQQAMSLAFFGMMIFILMGGLFTPIDSMPDWAIAISRLNPVSYFIEVVRLIVLKGSSFVYLKTHFVIISLMAVVFNSWAILNYRKTI